jgi:bifunctional polynucleotide phosphatase/kinase
MNSILFFEFFPENKNYAVNKDGLIEIAAFDLDHTIIKPKSGNIFPKDKNDWDFLNNMKERIQQISNEKFFPMIFTNQGSKIFNTIEFCEKLLNIFSALGNIYFQVYICTAKNGYYRKPCKGLWNYMLLNNKFKESDISREHSFYVGDAAGRSGDFSDSDLKFAYNNDLHFYVPEDFLNNIIDIPKNILKPYYKKDSLQENYDIKHIDYQELVILVGPPAAGKSYVCHNDAFKKYDIINQDTLGTKAKVIKAIKDSLKKGRSVVVDRQNKCIKDRQELIKVAKEIISDIPVCIIYIDVPKEIAEYMNVFRAIVKQLENEKEDSSEYIVPKIVYNKYYSKKEGGFQTPTKAESENITEVIVLKFQLFKWNKLMSEYLT